MLKPLKGWAFRCPDSVPAFPGKKADSLGQIALDVFFGDSKNYRKEKLTFEVVDF